MSSTPPRCWRGAQQLATPRGRPWQLRAQSRLHGLAGWFSAVRLWTNPQGEQRRMSIERAPGPLFSFPAQANTRESPVQHKTKIMSAAAGSLTLLGTFTFAAATSAAPPPAVPTGEGHRRWPAQPAEQLRRARSCPSSMPARCASMSPSTPGSRPWRPTRHAHPLRQGRPQRVPQRGHGRHQRRLPPRNTRRRPRLRPVRASLTKTGDTSPDSVLAVDRFPTAPHGMIHYDRTIRVGTHLAHAVRGGKARRGHPRCRLQRQRHLRLRQRRCQRPRPRPCPPRPPTPPSAASCTSNHQHSASKHGKCTTGCP